jgi:hypothetical protein
LIISNLLSYKNYELAFIPLILNTLSQFSYVNFKNPVIFSEDKDKIFTSHEFNWGGVCDQFAYGPSDLMDKFCDLFPNIRKYVEEGRLFHPETLLQYHCDKLGLEIVRQDVGLLGIVR